MVVEVYGTILREECFEVERSQSMRMRAVGFENHEVGHIHHTHTQLRKTLTEERCGCNHFESHLYADAHKYDVRVNTTIDARKLPDRGAGNAML